jgi:hypothetical protein
MLVFHRPVADPEGRNRAKFHSSLMLGYGR